MSDDQQSNEEHVFRSLTDDEIRAYIESVRANLDPVQLEREFRETTFDLDINDVLAELRLKYGLPP